MHHITKDNLDNYYNLIYYILKRQHPLVDFNDYEDLAHDVFIYIMDKDKPVNTGYLSLVVKKCAQRYCDRKFRAKPIDYVQTSGYTDYRRSEILELASGLLDPRHRVIVNMAMEGFTDIERADEVSVTPRQLRRLKTEIAGIIKERID